MMLQVSECCEVQSYPSSVTILSASFLSVLLDTFDILLCPGTCVVSWRCDHVSWPMQQLTST
jgi:hypothetical protein